MSTPPLCIRLCLAMHLYLWRSIWFCSYERRHIRSWDVCHVFGFELCMQCLIITHIHSQSLRIAQLTQDSHHSKKYTSSIIKLQRLLTPAIRMIICAFLAMISSNLLSIVGIYRLNQPDTQMLWVAHVAWGIWDMFINILCLHLQYSFSDVFYQRLCRKIHICIYAMFVRKMNSNVNQSQKTSTMDAHMEALHYPLQPAKRRETSEESTHASVTETTGLKLSRISEERSNVSTASHLNPRKKQSEATSNSMDWIYEDNAVEMTNAHHE
eukprot:1078668_1